MKGSVLRALYVRAKGNTETHLSVELGFGEQKKTNEAEMGKPKGGDIKRDGWEGDFGSS